MRDLIAAKERAAREQAAYNRGDVWQEANRLQTKFYHVFESPNTLYGEQLFEGTLQRFCPGATVLDYGCFDGILTPKYVDLGAEKIIGIDISDHNIAEAKRRYGSLGDFYVCDAHAMTVIPDSSIDLVVGRAILHHLDLTLAMPEVLRVLRKGGTALFAEPLYNNPASIAFRKLSPNARTADERPLSREQITWVDSLFSSSDHRYCNLVTTPLAMISSLVSSKSNNGVLHAADKIDRKLERTPIRYWMRIVYLCWTK